MRSKKVPSGDSRLTSPKPEPPAVSIILPVYNTRDYLPRCLDSVLSQTLQNIEIVAIDDASTDDSLDILQRYARDDRRITIVRHERNQGLHVARISGVQASSGQYLGYVDSDDYVSSEMFECMYRPAVEQGADVVRTGAWLLREGVERRGQDVNPATCLSFASHTYATGIDYLDADFYPSMWLHLHHQRLWHLALPHFPRIRLVGEDNLTSFVLAFFAGKTISLSNLEYFYVERDNSLSGDFSFPSVARHIEDRGRIVGLLRAFVNAAGGRAARCLNTLTANNRGLLFSYISSLGTLTDRLAAIELFQSAWHEPVPAELKSAWTALER